MDIVEGENDNFITAESMQINDNFIDVNNNNNNNHNNNVQSPELPYFSTVD